MCSDISIYQIGAAVEIRTLGSVSIGSFQDYFLRPLGHSGISLLCYRYVMIKLKINFLSKYLREYNLNIDLLAFHNLIPRDLQKSQAGFRITLGDIANVSCPLCIDYLWILDLKYFQSMFCDYTPSVIPVAPPSRRCVSEPEILHSR